MHMIAATDALSILRLHRREPRSTSSQGVSARQIGHVPCFPAVWFSSNGSCGFLTHITGYCSGQNARHVSMLGGNGALYASNLENAATYTWILYGVQWDDNSGFGGTALEFRGIGLGSVIPSLSLQLTPSPLLHFSIPQLLRPLS